MTFICDIWTNIPMQTQDKNELKKKKKRQTWGKEYDRLKDSQGMCALY